MEAMEEAIQRRALRLRQPSTLPGLYRATLPTLELRLQEPLAGVGSGKGYGAAGGLLRGGGACSAESKPWGYAAAGGRYGPGSTARLTAPRLLRGVPPTGPGWPHEPWRSPYGGTASGLPPSTAAAHPYGAATPGLAPGMAPTDSRHTGSDRRILHEKVALDKEMKYDGGKTGPAWKSRTYNYFISKALDAERGCARPVFLMVNSRA